jgi:ferrous iron transport protein B
VNSPAERLPTLLALEPGQAGRILAVHGEFRQRLLEMGFARGQRVRLIKRAPLADPLEYALRGGHVALRREEAELVEIELEECAGARR